MNLEEALQFLEKTRRLFADHRYFDVGEYRHFPNALASGSPGSTPIPQLISMSASLLWGFTRRSCETLSPLGIPKIVTDPACQADVLPNRICSMGWSIIDADVRD